jgi:hypothetical protein
MRFKTGLLLVVILGAIIFTVAGCKPASVKPNIITFSYVNPILNPPDTFQVAYDLNLLGNRAARITFQDSAVWKIEVMTQSLATFGFINPADNTIIYLDGNDSIGFKGGTKYSFVLNNSTEDTLSGLYFVKFTKLPQLDYSTFYRRY